MRGKGGAKKYCNRYHRITPAYAGKSGDAEERYFAIGDHPRLCGEKLFTPFAKSRRNGSPPPMRGKEDFDPEEIDEDGITPAYAGKSPTL